MIARHKDKRVNWAHPDTRAHIRTLLKRGRSLTAIASLIHVTPSALQEANRHHHFDETPPGKLTTSEAALELELSVDATQKLLSRKGIHTGRWGRYATVSAADVWALKASRAPRVMERPDGYATRAELSAAWRESKSRTMQRLAGVPYVVWVTTPRVTHLYDTRLAAQVAPPVGPIECPQGHITAPALAALLGVQCSTFADWAREGMPRTRGRRAYFYRPDAVAAWLTAHPEPRRQRKGRYLARITAQREAA